MQLYISDLYGSVILKEDQVHEYLNPLKKLKRQETGTFNCRYYIQNEKSHQLYIKGLRSRNILYNFEY